MKKIIFFLIIAVMLQNSITNVQAASTKFFEGEYIEGIWMNKAPGRGNNVTYYQKARFFRQMGTNDFAYCIEPFKFFEANGSYQPTITPESLSEQQRERISELAHFGYGYYNHTSEKWYAITQFMIWAAADPGGDYYFTDSLNGKRITRFQEEMNEINNLINNYHTNPSMTNQVYQMVEGESLKIVDNNYVLNNYKSNNPNIRIENNHLIITNLPLGEQQITLERQDNLYNRPIIFYQASTSQDLVETGNLNSKEIRLTVKTNQTEIKVNKIDHDSKTTIASGDAKLEGALYQIYDQNMNKLTTLLIDKNCQGIIKNISYGKYYIQEISAGIGYQVDKKIYPFEITKEKSKIELILENKVIKSKIKINKVYGTNNHFKEEENINFNIYHKGKLIKTITTNKDGYAEIELPYGTYKIEQVNTTEGYQKVESFEIVVTTEESKTFQLTNYKIPVPNTSTTILENIYLLIIKLFQGLLYA